MRINEIRVVFESDDNIETKKQISDIFYSFGVMGLKIEEPLTKLNPLDYYKNPEEFYNVENSISAYFPENAYSVKRNDLIKEKIGEMFDKREDMVYSIDIYSLEEEDYQNSWKNYLFPEKISEKFVVKPTWREYIPEIGELVIELDPGRAFGTGSHSTTSLCIKLMEEYIKDPSKEISLLDVGTGSGILMIAGSKLGIKRTVGVDIDELAVEVAKENLELNKINKKEWDVYKGDLLSTVGDEKFDYIVANILTDVILILIKDMARVVKKGGKIILSGILETKLSLLVNEIEKLELNYEILEVKKDKEWCGILIQA